MILKKDTINPWPQLDKLRISSNSCNVLCLLSPKRKKTAYWHHYVIIIIIITIIDCQSILINSHLKSDQLIKYVNKLGSITNRCKNSQHLTVAIERLRARTIPWFFGHFWKCSEVVVNYFWTLSKMAEKSRDRSCSEPSNWMAERNKALGVSDFWYRINFSMCFKQGYSLERLSSTLY